MVEVLVTGGAGFIGSNFVRHAPGHARRLARHDARQADLCRAPREPARRDGSPAARVRARRHLRCAAGGAARRAIERGRPLRRRNARRPIDPGGGRFHSHRCRGHVRAARSGAPRTGLKRFVQISTDEVYGSVPVGASTERDELKPRNPYSASKAGADRLAYSYFATYDVPVIITRASNNYGPYQFPEKVLPLFVTNLVDDLPVPLYGDGVQRPRLAARDRSLPRRRFPDRRGDERRGLQHRRRQRSAQHRPDARDSRADGEAASLIKPVADRPGHDRRYALDTTKLRTLGWAPQVPFAEGLRETRRLVSRKRVVVAPGQGARPGVQGVLRSAVRQALTQLAHESLSTCRCPILVTGAAGFVGGHLLDRLLAEGDRRSSAGTVPARRRRSSDRRAVEADRDCSTAAAVDASDRETCADGRLPPRRRRARRAVVAAHVRDLPEQRPRHASPARRAAPRGTEAARPGRRLRDHLRAAGSPDSRGRRRSAPTSPYATSKLAQEMLARRAWRRRRRARRCSRDRSITSGRDRIPSFVASRIARQIALIEAGRRSRVLDARQPRAAARSHRRARHRSRVCGDDGAQRRRGSRTTSAPAAGLRSATLVETLRRAARGATSQIVQDPALFRPNDPPLLVGDHSRLTARHRLDSRDSASSRRSTTCSAIGGKRGRLNLELVPVVPGACCSRPAARH